MGTLEAMASPAGVAGFADARAMGWWGEGGRSAPHDVRLRGGLQGAAAVGLRGCLPG